MINLCRHAIFVLVVWLPFIFNSPTHQELGIFAIKFLEFHNHAHRRLDHKCCGQSALKPSVNVSALCTAECAIKFRVCIEPYSAGVNLIQNKPYAGPCVYGQTQTGHWGNTDIMFDKANAQSYFINITLPWPNLFTVILEAYDLISSTEKYLIDRAVHRALLRPLINRPWTDANTKFISSEWHQVTISTRYSGYTFCLRVSCASNRYSNDCTKFCLSNSNETRYSCDLNGNKICEPGWSGTECDKAICNVGCHPIHGSCKRPGECECATGWQGTHCNECIKYPGCKHGTCMDAPFTCHCLYNWGGPFCDQDLDYCSRHEPCLNNGICKNLNSTDKSFYCICTKDFTGEYCEKKLKPCTVNPCRRGECIIRNKWSYECKCEPGWTGDHCDKNIDYCLTNSCVNGGTCQDLDGIGFKCLCPPGFKGSNCQIRSPCSNSQCVHARDCTQLMEPVNGINYACTCQPGWTGQFCDQNIDNCVDKCQNGGTCQDLLDDFYCICPLGFSGRYCETNKECANHPCQNKGICHEIAGGYRCECPNGVVGNNCEIVLSGCNPNLCQNGAYCYTLPEGFYCKCPDNFYGQFCEHKRPYCGSSGCNTILDPCLSSLELVKLSNENYSLNSIVVDKNQMFYSFGVCGPHGTCIGQNTGDYDCVCSTGFKGKYCHEPVNYCESNPCMHGATCVNGLETYECICEEGFVGKQCENPINLCHPNPCQNNGYCQQTLHPGDFQCQCASGWSGRWCEFQSDNPCHLGKICFNNGLCLDDSLSSGSFRCECDHQWMGSVCQLRRPEFRACAQQTLCKNGATCVDLGNSFSCICYPGYDGQYCENDINECNSMPCYNNGTCKDLINSFECDCPKGFLGTDCRIDINECATNPCAYGSTCIDRVGYYECACPDRRYGIHCDQVMVEFEPRPPACNFYGRIYNHNDTWTHSCQKCHCNTGQIICTDDFCGYWSCSQASSQSDRFACQPGEICHIVSSGTQNECFVPPCYVRTMCLNASRPIADQLEHKWPKFHLPLASPGCRPNAFVLNNNCARIGFKFAKFRMPYSITLDDVCSAFKSLSTLQSLHKEIVQMKHLGMSCDIKAKFENKDHDVIEVTLSSIIDDLKPKVNGKRFSFVHDLARNLSKEAALKAATNINYTKRSSNLTQFFLKNMHIDEHDESVKEQIEHMPLPPIAMMFGTNELMEYWHRILLGIVEIHIDTMVVNEDELGPTFIIPLTCALILLVTVIIVILICCYAQVKRRELLLKYAPLVKPNNETDKDFDNHKVWTMMPSKSHSIIYPTTYPNVKDTRQMHSTHITKTHESAWNVDDRNQMFHPQHSINSALQPKLMVNYRLKNNMAPRS